MLENGFLVGGVAIVVGPLGYTSCFQVVAKFLIYTGNTDRPLISVEAV